jgi:uncharacterized protein
MATIDHINADGEFLRTSISGRARPMATAALIYAFLRFPLMTFGVIFRIHWQALKLWIKGARFYRKPAPPSQDLTR